MISRSSHTALLVVAGFTLFTPLPSTAQESVDPDTREVNAYVLTESGLENFAQAMTNLGPLAGQLGGGCDASAEDAAEDTDDGGNDQSLAGQVARINDIPAAAAAIESAGMQVREFVVFIWSAIQNGVAAWILTQPGGELPPGVSMANVEFYRSHEAEMKTLAQQVQPGGCEDDDEYAEEEEYPEDEDSIGDGQLDGEDN